MENIHVFEQAGLGIAPFTFETAIYGDWTNCEFCGHDIKERCYIRDVNNKQFFVGNECVNKTGDTGLVNATQVAIKELRKVRKREREDKRILDGKLFLIYSEKLKNILANTLRNTDRPQSITLLKWIENNYNAYWASRKSKLEASATIFENAERYLTLDEINGFWDSREEILAQLEAQKQKESEEKAKQAEIARQERAIKLARIQEDNKELINVLSSSRPSPFVQDMIWKLKAQELTEFSIRQVEVLADIYGKTFGKQGSEEYREAYNKIYRQGMR